MRSWHVSAFAAVLLVGVVSCKPSGPTTAPIERDGPGMGDNGPGAAVGGPLDGIACVGSIAAPPPGARPVDDSPAAGAVLQKSLGATDAGSLCTGQVFEAAAPIKVYRVWNSEKEYTQMGGWWSFDAPSGTREQYREQNAVCEEWSKLDRLIVCEIKVGALFVVGPGQSATCKVGPSYPKSATNQVFIPNDGRKGEIFVERCEQLGDWP